MSVNFNVSTPFSQIPRDVNLYILRKLSIRDLGMLACVDTTFKLLANDFMLWELNYRRIMDMMGKKVVELPKDPKSNIRILVEKRLKLAIQAITGGFSKESVESVQDLFGERDINGDSLLHHFARRNFYAYNIAQRYPSHRSRVIPKKLYSGDFRLEVREGIKIWDKLRRSHWSVQNNSGMTPLHVAAVQSTNKDTLIDLFPYMTFLAERNGFDFSTRDNYGRTVLHIAANKVYYSFRFDYEEPPLCCDISDLLRLLDPNDIDLPDNFGFTPLSYALLGCNRDAASKLLRAGAELEKALFIDVEKALISLKNHRTPETDGSNFCKEEVEKLKELYPNNIKSHSDALEYFVKAFKYREGDGNFDECEPFWLFSAFRKFVAEIPVERVNNLCFSGYTILGCAVMSGDSASVSKLLDKGANPFQRFGNAYSSIIPMSLAISSGPVEIFDLFMDSSAIKRCESSFLDTFFNYQLLFRRSRCTNILQRILVFLEVDKKESLQQELVDLAFSDIKPHLLFAVLRVSENFIV